ncbi:MULTISPECIES: deoxyribonuclease IV [unclassified Thermotoga]|uniref:deoxyribonuclease IV n=1 Tax=unclassified Thermotoga TaxID=2631113 RepID=UPI000280E7A9|nr:MULTISPECIES: deoxyribonuclease IV [unclassified Thermotoga]AIY86129.1 deoxyribonuclease IV [Thermotoga sp. 2812B]EJX26065.1 deoxyribonuclease IV [Thermotoga sp. EMP]
MIKIGAHMPISKGFDRVPQDTVNIGGNSFQIFPHNARSWSAKLPSDEAATKFKREMKKHGIDWENAFCHSGYLINLASPKDDIWQKSVELLKKEVEICRKLGIRYLNIHPGSHLGTGEEEGIDRIVRGLNEVLNNTEGVVILLENVSQKGGNIGYKLEQLKKIRDLVDQKDRVAITYDTCHGFDSGYDITKKEGVEALLNEIESLFGLERLKMIHLNDSKYPLGAAKDRHERIGSGFIGEEGFAVFFSFKEIQEVPWILETPGGNEEHAEDIKKVFEIIEKFGIEVD